MFNQLETLSDEQSDKLIQLEDTLRILIVFVLLIPEELTVH